MSRAPSDASLLALREEGLSAAETTALERRFEAVMADPMASGPIAEFDTLPEPHHGSSNLDTALEIALANNISIGRAAERISRADAERMNAIFGYLPQLRATGNYNNINQNVISSDNAVFVTGTARYNSLDYALELNQPLVDLSRIFGIEVATTMRSAAQVDYILTVQEVLYETFDAYVLAAQSNARQRILQQRAGLLRRQLQTEFSRTTEGIADQSVLLTLEIELANLQVEIADEALRYTDHRARLFSLTGTEFSEVSIRRIPPNVFGAEKRVKVSRAVQQAVETNPRILRSIIAVAENDLRQKQASSADFAPVIDAFARLEYEDREASRFGGGSETQDIIAGVRLTVPIFNAQGNGYRTLTAKIDFRDAVLEYLEEKRSVETDVRATHQRLKEIARALSRARSGLNSANRLVADEEARVEAGTSQEVIVTAIRSRALEAREQVQFYELEYLRTWGRLEYLTAMNLIGSLR